MYTEKNIQEVYDLTMDDFEALSLSIALVVNEFIDKKQRTSLVYVLLVCAIRLLNLTLAHFKKKLTTGQIRYVHVVLIVNTNVLWIFKENEDE